MPHRVEHFDMQKSSLRDSGYLEMYCHFLLNSMLALKSEVNQANKYGHRRLK